jgi:hypothetical protein
MPQFLRTQRVSPALVVAFLALFVAISGGAYAATGNSHGAQPTAHAAKKHRKHHRRHRHSSSGSNGSNGANGSNGSSGGAGMTGKQGPQGLQGPQGPQGPIGPSNGFVSNQKGDTPIGTGPDDSVIATLSLPPNSNYIVTAAAELGNTGATANSVHCSLEEGFNPITSGTEDLTPLATYSHTLTLTAASSGGAIKLACQGDKSALARNRVITAIRVGSLEQQ